MSFEGEPPDPLKSVAEGVAQGTLEWTAEKIEDIVCKFIDKKLAFIEDAETIKIIKRQKQKAEFGQFKYYCHDKYAQIIFQAGLALREYEENASNTKYDELIRKLGHKFKTEGIHLSWFAKDGLFGEYLTILLNQGLGEEEIRKEFNILINNIELHVAFISNEKVNSKKTIKQKAEEITSKITSHSPNIFIITGMGLAKQKAEEIHRIVTKKICDYDCKIISTKNKEIFILTYNEMC